MVSYLTGHNINICDHKGFPSPLEVWVVSYELISKWGSQDKEEFPSPLEVWVVSYELECFEITNEKSVSVPSRGMGGFLQDSRNT